jgi:hypothetical protein
LMLFRRTIRFTVSPHQDNIEYTCTFVQVCYRIIPCLRIVRKLLPWRAPVSRWSLVQPTLIDVIHSTGLVSR